MISRVVTASWGLGNAESELSFSAIHSRFIHSFINNSVSSLGGFVFAKALIKRSTAQPETNLNTKSQALYADDANNKPKLLNETKEKPFLTCAKVISFINRIYVCLSSLNVYLSLWVMQINILYYSILSRNIWILYVLFVFLFIRFGNIRK